MRILSLFTAAGFCLAATGCFATGGETRTIKSTPSGALVQIAGYGDCETPCTIKLDGRRDVTVAKAGYKAQRFGVSPGGGDVNVILELAAPTEEVATETLPELD
jgi:hypothetical protein